MRRWNVKDLVGGLLFAAVGLFFLIGGLGLRFGTAFQMGPGYVPVLLSLVLIALSLVTIVRAAGGGEAVYSGISWRPMIAVSVSIVAFGIVFRFFGFVPAIAATVAVSALGDRTSRPLGTILTAAVLALTAWLIFRVGLGLPMPAFRGF